MENEKVIRTIIVQSDELTRKVTKCICDVNSNLLVCSEFDNAEDALSYCVNNVVDLIILDMWLPVMTGIDAVRVFKYINPNIKIVMVVPDESDFGLCAQGTIFADADAYLKKDFEADKISKVVSIIFNGGYWIDYRFQINVQKSICGTVFKGSLL